MKEREDLMEQKVTHKQWLIVRILGHTGYTVPNDIVEQYIVVATYICFILDDDIGRSTEGRWGEVKWDFEWPYGKG